MTVIEEIEPYVTTKFSRIGDIAETNVFKFPNIFDRRAERSLIAKNIIHEYLQLKIIVNYQATLEISAVSFMAMDIIADVFKSRGELYYINYVTLNKIIQLIILTSATLVASNKNQSIAVYNSELWEKRGKEIESIGNRQLERKIKIIATSLFNRGSEVVLLYDYAAAYKNNDLIRLHQKTTINFLLSVYYEFINATFINATWVYHTSINFIAYLANNIYYLEANTKTPMDIREFIVLNTYLTVFSDAEYYQALKLSLNLRDSVTFDKNYERFCAEFKEVKKKDTDNHFAPVIRTPSKLISRQLDFTKFKK